MKHSRSARNDDKGDKPDVVDVIIETPKGSRNKFKWDVKRECFRLDKVLPAGATFPYDFGYVPGTRAPDGDPIDVMILMDEPAFPGCLIPCRLIGVIEAEQTEDSGQTVRNDRLIAVASDAHNYFNVHSLSDVSKNLIEELGHFFVSYHAMRRTHFKVLGIAGPKEARKLLNEAARKAPKA